MMDGMPRPRPQYLLREKTRHGRLVWYVRVGMGKRVRLPDGYGTEEFWEAYRSALSGKVVKTPAGPPKGSLGWLLARYIESAEWSDLSAATRKQRHAVYRVVTEASGNQPLAKVRKAAILAGRDRRKDRPHAANNFLKAMRGLFGWAIERGHVTDNPTAGIKLLGGANDENGFHAWTEEEVARFEEHWQIGTRQRLAFDLLLYTGLRRGDAVKLGRQHVRSGELAIRTEKTGSLVTRPILPALHASIAATTTGDLAFIVTERGKPFTKESFGIWFKKACVAAGVPGSAHGLRKAGARRAAEDGATEAQLNALFGWKPGSRESATYTRDADNARLARSAPVRSPAPVSAVRGSSEKR
jgi:integrase